MTLFVSDSELAGLLGVKPKEMNALALVWERSGFPLPDPQLGKRYWPAVKAWLDRKHGLYAQSGPGQDGEETW